MAWDFTHRLLRLLVYMVETKQAYAIEIYPQDNHTHTHSLSKDKKTKITKHNKKHSIRKNRYIRCNGQYN